MSSTSSRSNERLMIFAKAPESGRAKTRLIPALGPDGAARLHGCFTRDVVARHRREDRQLTLWKTGQMDHPIWAELGGEQIQQPEGDLGARMLAAFGQTLATHKKVVILGTDSPTLPPSFVDQAFIALETHAVVLGPACDGGYYLMGLNVVVPELFDQMPWGSAEVLVQTLRRVKQAGLSLKLLPFWYDIDRPADLELLKAHAPVLEAEGIPLPLHALEALKC